LEKNNRKENPSKKKNELSNNLFGIESSGILALGCAYEIHGIIFYYVMFSQTFKNGNFKKKRDFTKKRNFGLRPISIS